MTIWAAIASLGACFIGAGLGLFAMINPRWASGVVRLAPKEGKVEGKSEFRATYGGLFLAAHAFGAFALSGWYEGGVFAAAVLGAAWAGAAFGRLLSFWLDGAATKLNAFNVGFEIVLSLALFSPLMTWKP